MVVAFLVGGWDARGFIDGGTFSASKLGNVKTFEIRERSCLQALTDALALVIVKSSMRVSCV
jgi:hypothetical protein